MPDIVIQAENLGKKYTIGHQAENGRYVARRDVLVNNALRNQLCISTLVLRSAECADHRAPGGGSRRDARVVGTEREAIVRGTAALLENTAAYAQMAQAMNPFGDGKAAERIVAMLHS